MRKSVLVFITLYFLISLKGYSDTTKIKSLVVPQVLNEMPMDTPVASLSNQELENESSSHKISINLSEAIAAVGVIVSICGLVISFLSNKKSSKAILEAHLLDQDVKRLEIKMKTSDLIVSKRLEVFPKLHILTDTLGAAIRYYKNHINDTENKDWNTMVLKREIKSFHQKLSFWDANYCIYAGNYLTLKVGNLRKELEKEEDWDKKEITKEIVDHLYEGLQNVEHELKNEMKIHFTEYEERNTSTDEKR